ncbi:hypothetical protein EF910_32090 [Streptomyces sp. WAC07149]|uniref:hypothetical protein n=1 Tax=Streptomyces sp. WAC07149 TaxID=2487425 RepID=UPI000F7B9749|nr:hypothetical protein [Streptomyces sp. WAC07149]RST00377.1 hypothetical protein EF910_32090 [Streptomyces sp. WAC07149]
MTATGTTLPLYRSGSWTDVPSPLPEVSDDWAKTLAELHYEPFLVPGMPQLNGATVRVYRRAGGESDHRFLIELASKQAHEMLLVATLPDVMKLLGEWLPTLAPPPVPKQKALLDETTDRVPYLEVVEEYAKRNTRGRTLVPIRTAADAARTYSMLADFFTRFLVFPGKISPDEPFRYTTSPSRALVDALLEWLEREGVALTDA